MCLVLPLLLVCVCSFSSLLSSLLLISKYIALQAIAGAEDASGVRRFRGNHA